jgi:hypothetical protein
MKAVPPGRVVARWNKEFMGVIAILVFDGAVVVAASGWKRRDVTGLLQCREIGLQA